MSNNKRIIIWIVVVSSIITTIILVKKNIYQNENIILVLKNEQNDNVLAEYKLNENGDFAVMFRHSVNQSIVEDRYKVVDCDIVVYETLYYNFGAGVQTVMEDGQTLTETDDGGMIVGGIDSVMDRLIYRPSPVYDHTLKVGDQEFSLTDLAVDCDLILFQIK